MSDNDLRAAFRTDISPEPRAEKGLRFTLSALIYGLCSVLIGTLVAIAMTYSLHLSNRLFAPDGFLSEIIGLAPLLIGGFAVVVLPLYGLARWRMGPSLRGGWLWFPLIWILPAVAALALVGPYGLPQTLQQVRVFFMVTFLPGLVVGLVQIGLERRVQGR